MDQAQVPHLRGVLHLVAAPLAVVGGLLLVLAAESGPIRWAVAIFVLTSVALFATSPTYHMGAWVPKTKAMLRRADHSVEVSSPGVSVCSVFCDLASVFSARASARFAFLAAFALSRSMRSAR